MQHESFDNLAGYFAELMTPAINEEDKNKNLNFIMKNGLTYIFTGFKCNDKITGNYFPLTCIIKMNDNIISISNPNISRDDITPEKCKIKHFGMMYYNHFVDLVCNASTILVDYKIGNVMININDIENVKMDNII